MEPPGHGLDIVVPDSGDGAGKSARERFAEFLRIYGSVNTRIAYATDLGIPLDWVPGHIPPDPTRRRGRRRRDTATGLEWLTWCTRQGFTSFEQVRVEHVERWLEELAGQGYSPATRARMLSAVSAFYRKYLLRENLVTHNPVTLVDRRTQHLNQPRGTPSKTQTWSFQTCRALLLAAWLLADRHRDGRRDRAMVEVLIGTGIRAEELVGINLADHRRPTPGGPAVLRVHGKGGKDRHVALAPPVADALDTYLTERVPAALPAPRGPIGITSPVAVFLTHTGNRVHVTHLRAVLRGLCAAFTTDPTPHRAAGLTDTTHGRFITTHLTSLRETIHPHSARHSYATHAVARGVTPRQIQHDLGHTTLAITEGYLHDNDTLAGSAAHHLAPALHQGWLDPG